MAELTPIERAMRVFDREPVDKMPFYTGMGMVLAPPIKERGWPFPKVHLEAEKLAWSGIDSARYAKLDSVVIPYDMCWESEALGNTISLYEDSEDILYPTIPHKNWEEVEQVEITDDDINNIMQRGRMPLIPPAIKMIKENAPEIALGTWELGPFTQCGQTIELDRVLKAVFKKKDLVTHILDRFTDMICTIVQELQAAGGDFFTLREPGVAADLLSPRTFKELIMPTMIKILSAWKGNKKCFHICGSTDPICEMMWECCVQSGTPMISFISRTILWRAARSWVMRRLLSAITTSSTCPAGRRPRRRKREPVSEPISMVLWMRYGPDAISGRILSRRTGLRWKKKRGPIRPDRPRQSGVYNP
jgi:[methyl-Co(III) methanol-specific corrinoid protein]:coenzyme M methyltransferase